jgi:hypothetical protein
MGGGLIENKSGSDESFSVNQGQVNQGQMKVFLSKSGSDESFFVLTSICQNKK